MTTLDERLRRAERSGNRYRERMERFRAGEVIAPVPGDVVHVEYHYRDENHDRRFTVPDPCQALVMHVGYLNGVVSHDSLGFLPLPPFIQPLADNLFGLWWCKHLCLTTKKPWPCGCVSENDPTHDPCDLDTVRVIRPTPDGEIPFYAPYHERYPNCGDCGHRWIGLKRDDCHNCEKLRRDGVLPPKGEVK